jgi:hypothetical protein
MKRSWNHPKGTATPPYLFSWVHQPTSFAGQAGHHNISLSNDFGCSIVCYTNSLGESIVPLAHFRCGTLFIKTLSHRSPTEFIFLLTLIQLRFKGFYLHPTFALAGNLSSAIGSPSSLKPQEQGLYL